MNPNMSLHLSTGFCDQLHGCATTFAQEVFGETLYAHAAPIAAAVRSFYRDILRFDLELADQRNIGELSARDSVAHHRTAAASGGVSTPLTVPDTYLSQDLDDVPPSSHWGINE